METHNNYRFMKRYLENILQTWKTTHMGILSFKVPSKDVQSLFWVP